MRLNTVDCLFGNTQPSMLQNPQAVMAQVAFYLSGRVVSSKSSGGAWQFMVQLAQGLAAISESPLAVGLRTLGSNDHYDQFAGCAEILNLAHALSEAKAVEAEREWLNSRQPQWMLMLYPSFRDAVLFRGWAKCLGVVVFDLQHIDWPKNFCSSERWKRDVGISTAVRCADLIATISEFSANRLRQCFGVDRHRLVVIYAGSGLAAPQRYEQPNEPPYILYPANNWPHKNHATLLAAFRLLRAKHSELQLYLTGHPVSRKLFENAAGRQPGVKYLGYVPEAKLAELMGGAECLVFPSLYEGFGMPVLEALQAGTPVACSNTTSLPEVGGEAAEYFDPTDPHDIVVAVERAMGNKDKAEWQQLAKKQADKFSFDRTARLLLEAMEQVGARAPDPAVLEARSTPPSLANYWRLFPSLDAVLLPRNCTGLGGWQPTDFKALERLDMARLCPVALGAFCTRGEEIPSAPVAVSLTFKRYRKVLRLVAANKVVIFPDARPQVSSVQRISRFYALTIVLSQLLILRRTCREAVLAVVLGRW